MYLQKLCKKIERVPRRAMAAANVGSSGAASFAASKFAQSPETFGIDSEIAQSPETLITDSEFAQSPDSDFGEFLEFAQSPAPAASP